METFCTILLFSSCITLLIAVVALNLNSEKKRTINKLQNQISTLENRQNTYEYVMADNDILKNRIDNLTYYNKKHHEELLKKDDLIKKLKNEQYQLTETQAKLIQAEAEALGFRRTYKWHGDKQI